MNDFKALLVLSLLVFLGYSCSDDDDATPEPVNEEEVITTMNISLTPAGGGTTVTLQSQDLDADGPNPPVVTVSGDLTLLTTYEGTIELLNETEDPVEDVTEEVEEEAEEHQFIFSFNGSISNISYDDLDSNGNPIGLNFVLATQQPGPASLTVTLRHEPKKPNDGTLEDAGGETDITQTFSLVVN